MMKKHIIIAAAVLGITMLMAQALYGYGTIKVEDGPSKLAPLKDGPVKILSIALNDKKGEWKLVVTEVISGKKAVTTKSGQPRFRTGINAVARKLFYLGGY